MAEQIRELGGREFHDPQDVHDSLTGLHELVGALQDVLHGYGERFDETGVHPRYGEAAREAAGGMAGIADSLEQVTAGGVMRGPGG
jgi:hypothetical protein